MATTITSECINCGACEPECPNTAIYQGGAEFDLDGKKHAALATEYFYIVPEKCTECVGFFDYEACAAVCPVDCCVPDPDRPESEAALLERARTLHPGKEFGDDFPSRFTPGRGKSESPPQTEANQAPVPAEAGTAPSTAVDEPAVEQLDDLEVPVVCRTCAGEFAVAYRFFQPGLVLRCPHCGFNFTPNQRLFLSVRDRMRRFADELNARIDACNAAVEAAHADLEEQTEALRDAVVRDVRALVRERTETRKAGLFG
jgi:ferredoxin